MKPYSHIQYALLITALLFSQLSSAFAIDFAASKQMQDCKMGMMAAADPHEMTSYIHIVDSGNSGVTEHRLSSAIDDTSTKNKMDCCDQGAPIACCDTECQCKSLFAAVVFVSQAQHYRLDTNKHINTFYYTSSAPQPYLHQPKRPPIYSAS